MLRVICKHDRAMRTLVKQLRFNNPVLYRPQDSAAVNPIQTGLFLLPWTGGGGGGGGGSGGPTPATLQPLIV